jgi:hypothetical protein
MTPLSKWTTRNGITAPASAAVSFTELKLSQSRLHAKEYGRLGIAVKRPFLFERVGRPIVYYGPRPSRDPILDEFAKSVEEKRLLHFWKPMDSGKDRSLNYDSYSESEWRLVDGIKGQRTKTIINPRDTDDAAISSYYQELSAAEKEKVQRLVPLDGWLGAIIYPNLKVKNAAQKEGSDIPGLIRAVANRGQGFRVEGENLPVELDLDLCRNL